MSPLAQTLELPSHMNLNFAEKIGIFLGATTLTFALGIAACSPFAPSVAKNQLGSKSTHQGPGDGNITPNPTPNGLHLLFYKSRGDATMIVGKDGYDWFFKSLSKNSHQYLISSESLPDPLERFKREGHVEIPIQPSNDWLISPDGKVSGTVSFQLDLAANGSFTPAQIDGISYKLRPPSAEEVRRAVDRHTTADWTLDLEDGGDTAARTVFLGALDAIRLSVNTKEVPHPAVSPAPGPNHASEELAEEAAPQE